LRKISNKSGGFTFLTAIILIAMAVIAVMCLTRTLNIIEQRQRLAAENESLISQSASLAEKLARLNAEAENGTDEAYVVSIARGNLDMVYPGEVIFRTGNN